MNKTLLLGLMLSAFLFPVFASAQDAPPPVAAETADNGQPVEVGNKICPVSHEAIGQEGMAPYQVTHNGKIYNFCCAMCEKDFNKDPEKYIKAVEEEMKAESIKNL